MEKLFIKALIEKTADEKYKVVASTSAVDRQGDSIDQAGWDLKNFMLNPVMLWAHDYSALPVAKATSITVVENKLVAEYEFAPAEGNPMAQQVKTLVDGGFLNAVSVGFMPLERNGNVITKMELFEISFVPVPANPQALQLMLGKGIAHDVITKFFEVKAGELEAAVKGAVSDELDAEEAMELKWSKWDEVCEVLGALWNVYFDEATPVESFSALLTESITLLQAVAANDGADDDSTDEAKAARLDAFKKAVGKEAAKSFIVKIGAKYSAQTKESINKAIEHAKSATALLTDLMTEAEESGEETDKAVEKTDAPEAGIDDVRALLITRDLLREKESAPRSALGAVNALIREKSGK